MPNLLKTFPGCQHYEDTIFKNLKYNIKVTFQVIYNFMKNYVLIHAISIHTNFHQNQSINECAMKILA